MCNRVLDKHINTTISYKPQITSVTDYYSFGSEIKERSYTTNTTYRYGFNNVEKVNEIYDEGVFNYYVSLSTNLI